MPPIIEELKDQRIAILGFGREGRSTYHYLRRYLPDQPLTIADLNPIDTQGLEHVQLIIGEDYQKLNDYDVIMKSPGIVMQESIAPEKLNSQSNLFLKYYGHQTIGITGTKGKSTTCSLLYHILKQQRKCVLLGNIGKPAFDQLDVIDEDTLVVYELSCHQLEYIRHAPHWGVLLNLYEEHLDHYGTFENYCKAKENIWRMQRNQDYLICEKSLACADIKAVVLTASMSDESADIYVDANRLRILQDEIVLQPRQTTLLGRHNDYDIAIDLYLAKQLGMDYADSLKALSSFQPLPHRLQYVGYYHYLHWYDDSISTICETTIQALQSLPQTDTLLLGGMDRGIDYTPLADYLNKHPVAHVILMYDSGTVLAKQLRIPFTMVADLQEAVVTAKHISASEGVVLLSPAAASYGFFKNFEERGDCFQTYIKQP